VEVEQALLSHPAVVEAAVIGVPDIDAGQRVVGLVVLDGATSGAPEEILQDVGRLLVAYKVPQRLLVVDHIPRNGTGKAIRPRPLEQATRMNARPGICMLSQR
jgi:acyl-coenzyme A synthetase/AMP-(fatty) acid ligase